MGYGQSEFQAGGQAGFLGGGEQAGGYNRITSPSQAPTPDGAKKAESLFHVTCHQMLSAETCPGQQFKISDQAVEKVILVGRLNGWKMANNRSITLSVSDGTGTVNVSLNAHDFLEPLTTADEAGRTPADRREAVRLYIQLRTFNKEDCPLCFHMSLLTGDITGELLLHANHCVRDLLYARHGALDDPGRNKDGQQGQPVPAFGAPANAAAAAAPIYGQPPQQAHGGYAQPPAAAPIYGQQPQTPASFNNPFGDENKRIEAVRRTVGQYPAGIMPQDLSQQLSKVAFPSHELQATLRGMLDKGAIQVLESGAYVV